MLDPTHSGSELGDVITGNLFVFTCRTTVIYHVLILLHNSRWQPRDSHAVLACDPNTEFPRMYRNIVSEVFALELDVALLGPVYHTVSCF